MIAHDRSSRVLALNWHNQMRGPFSPQLSTVAITLRYDMVTPLYTVLMFTAHTRRGTRPPVKRWQVIIERHGVMRALIVLTINLHATAHD